MPKGWCFDVLLYGGQRRQSVDDRKKIRCFSVDEQKKFVEVAKNHKHYEQYMVMLASGLRISELVGLSWDECHLDCENPYIHVVQQLSYIHDLKAWIWGPPKRGEKRIIPIDNECRKILLSIKECSKNISVTDDNKEFEDLVFRNERGFPIQSTTYRQHLKKMAIRYNMEHFHPHTLRHTYATRCLEQGVSLKAVSMALGHSSMFITESIYINPDDDFLHGEMKKVKFYISSNEKTA